VSAILNFLKKHKIKILMAETIIRETKREAQRKAKRCTTCGNQKKRKKLVLLVVRNYLTHGPFNVVYMQIVRSNSVHPPTQSSFLCRG